MTVTVLFFAHLQDIAKGHESSCVVDNGGTVGDLAHQLSQQYHEFAVLLPSIRAAVNGEHADFETVLNDGDEVAWMPPMSGGLPTIEITHDILDPEAIAKRVESSSSGAVLTFIGVVRDHARGQKVLYLEYEAYVPLAKKELQRIQHEAETKWNVRVAISHRLGRINIGEASVVVAVSSAHRAEAFDSCRWVMETLKAVVPIWKKEFVEGGAHWIEGPDAVPAVAIEP